MTLPDLTAPQWRRRLRLLAALAVLAVLLAAAWRLLTPLLPFLLGGAVAYLLLPLVNGIVRYAPGGRRWPNATRAATAGLITLLVIGLVLGILALALSRLVIQSTALVEYAPGFAAQLQADWRTLQEWYAAQVPQNVRDFIDPRLVEARNALVEAAGNALGRLLGFLRSGFTLVISLAALPLILFYVLYDPGGLGRGVLRLAPRPLRTDLAAICGLAGAVIGSYLRVQLLTAAVVGTVIGLSLWALQVPQAVVLGAIAAVAELVPMVGATVSLVIASVLTLLTDPVKAPIVIALYLVVQTLQNMVLTPRIQGTALGLHPLTVILALAIAGAFLGFWGVLAAAPLTAAGYRTLSYVAREWEAPVDADGDGDGDADTDTDTDTVAGVDADAGEG